MSNIPSALLKIQLEATQFRGPVSESTVQDIGASVNGLIDAKGVNDTDHTSFAAQLAALNAKVIGLASGAVNLTTGDFISGVQATLPITLTGRKVEFGFKNSTDGNSTIGVKAQGTGQVAVEFTVKRDGTRIYSTAIYSEGGADSGPSFTYALVPASSVRGEDSPITGAVVYTVEVAVLIADGVTAVNINNVAFYVREVAGY